MLKPCSSRRFVLTALASIALAGEAGAAIVVDQAHESPFGTTFAIQSSDFTWQQGVTSGVSGLLSSVDLRFTSVGTIDFFVNLGAPWQMDANDYQVLSLPVTLGWNNIDVSSANISLGSGDLFTIGLTGTGSSPGFTGSINSSYGGGALILNNSPNSPGNSDMNFRTYVDVPAVPVPAAVWLFGTALAGLFAFAGRRPRLSAWFKSPVNGI